MTKNNHNQVVLISGASGFLGGEIINQLSQEEKYEIIAFDIDKQSLYKRFSHINHIEYIDSNDWKNKQIPWHKIDIVIHCAFSRLSKGYLLAESLDFSGKFLLQAMQNNVQSIVNISSQGVYGRSTEPTWSEETQVDPDYLYALAKYASEVIVNTLSKSNMGKTYVTNLRLAGLTGAREGLKLEIVSRFVNNVLKGEPIKIVGGKQVFSNMDVRDAASGIIALLSINPDKWEPVYNLGNEWQCSIMEIAETIKKIAPKYTNYPVKIELEEKDVRLNSGLNPSKFFQTTGWKPEYNLKTIIEDLFEYFLKQ